MKRVNDIKGNFVLFLYFDFLIYKFLKFGLLKAFIDDFILAYRQAIRRTITFRCPVCLSSHFWKNGHEPRMFGPPVQKFICPHCGKNFCENTFSPFYYCKYPVYLILASLKLKSYGKQIDKIRLMSLFIYIVNKTVSFFMPCYHTISRWIKKFGLLVINGSYKFKLKASRWKHWEVDEEFDSRIIPTKAKKYAKNGKKKVGTVGVKDPVTKLIFLHSTKNQEEKDLEPVIRRTISRWNQIPRSIWRDGWQAYKAPLERLNIPQGVVIHKKEWKSKRGHHTNNIESQWWDKRTWIKPCRGFKTFEGHEFYNKYYEVSYNFFRAHSALNGLTPAQKAGVKEIVSYLSMIL